MDKNIQYVSSSIEQKTFLVVFNAPSSSGYFHLSALGMYSAVLPGTDDYTLEYIQMSKISPRFSEDYIRTRKTKKTLSIRFTVCHMMWSRCIPYTSFPNLVAS